MKAYKSFISIFKHNVTCTYLNRTGNTHQTHTKLKHLPRILNSIWLPPLTTCDRVQASFAVGMKRRLNPGQ